MKIIIVGGHPTPAFAVLEKLPKDLEIVFVGRKYMLEGDKTTSLEYRTIKEKGLRFVSINTGRFNRNIDVKSITSLLKVPMGLLQSVALLKREKPDAVLAFGGYVSVPVGMAAAFLRIPLIIHEQTLEAGLANKILANLATKICISWPQSADFFPKEKVVITGNPMREFQSVRHPELGSGPHSEIDEMLNTFDSLSVSLVQHDNKPLLYVTGGSTGSHAINVLIEANMDKLLDKFTIFHQTGDAQEYGDYERLRKERSHLSKNKQERYILTKFVPADMVGWLFKKARFVIGRAGMNTITELLAFGTPSLLIPLPSGQKSEQLKNAQLLKKVGISNFVTQSGLTPEKFMNAVMDLVDKRGIYAGHAEYAKSLVKTDAAERIIEVVYDSIGSKK